MSISIISNHSTYSILTYICEFSSLNGLQEHEMSVFNLYSSAKHALRVQFEAIRRELSQHTEKIKITVSKNTDLEEKRDPLP